jgi:hypothetical protein
VQTRTATGTSLAWRSIPGRSGHHHTWAAVDEDRHVFAGALPPPPPGFSRHRVHLGVAAHRTVSSVSKRRPGAAASPCISADGRDPFLSMRTTVGPLAAFCGVSERERSRSSRAAGDSRWGRGEGSGPRLN